MLRRIVHRWFPALLMMAVIFVFSAQPAENLPNFSRLDRLVKKGGHMLGYGLLAVSYWRGLGWEARRRPIAWLFAVLYAAADEFHQSFVPGRSASLWDVVIFDSLGAFVGIGLAKTFCRSRR